MKSQVEAVAKEKVNAAYGELKLATLEDIQKLEKRIEALERKNLDE